MNKLNVKWGLAGLILFSTWVFPGMALAADQPVKDQELIDNFKAFTPKDLANALINYEAAARLNEYQLNEQLMFMPAPGSAWAISAGTAIGGANVQSAIQASISSNFMNSS